MSVRRFRLTPIAPSRAGMNIGITLPAAVPVAAQAACQSGSLTWGYVGDYTTVTASANPAYGSSYTAPTFRIDDSTNDYAEWEIDTTALDVPLICRLDLITTGMESELDGLIMESGYGAAFTTVVLTPYPTDGTLQQWFFLAPGTTARLACYTPSAGLSQPVQFTIAAARIE